MKQKSLKSSSYYPNSSLRDPNVSIIIPATILIRMINNSRLYKLSKTHLKTIIPSLNPAAGGYNKKFPKPASNLKVTSKVVRKHDQID